MATIHTKYNIGDRVWVAYTTTERKSHPCPDCLGKKAWQAQSPAGGEYTFACPRCSAGYMNDHRLSLDFTQFIPSAHNLTIGSVRVDTHDMDRPVEYMCVETGVGSGSIYDEKKLFLTYEEAMTAAAIEAQKQNKEVDWVVKQYNKSLEVKDYQLSNASLELSKRIRSRNQFRVSVFIDDLREAQSLDEVKDIIENFVNKPSEE